MESTQRRRSVVIFRLRDMRPGTVEAYLDQALASAVRELQEGAIVVVSEALIRVRSLPIDLSDR
jgi:predicted nuclease of predicted toxin-antitoxin system